MHRNLFYGVPREADCLHSRLGCNSGEDMEERDGKIRRRKR